MGYMKITCLQDENYCHPSWKRDLYEMEINVQLLEMCNKHDLFFQESRFLSDEFERSSTKGTEMWKLTSLFIAECRTLRGSKMYAIAQLPFV